MANIFKFQATNKVKDTVGLGFANVSAGDIFYLTDIQLKKNPIRNALALGYIEPFGEDSSGISSDMMDYWNSTVSYNKNMMPAYSIQVVPPIAAGSLVNVASADLAAGYIVNRKSVITGVNTKFSTASDAINAPRLLVTSGDSSLVTPTLLTTYDDTAGTYTAATNGAIAAVVPIAWAADDMLIVGYTEKFSSVVCNMTTPSNQANVATPYYWDGTQWVEFSTSTDYTIETAGRTLSRVGDNDNSRMVWWEMPDAWVVGGPSGSLATSTDYCVAIKFSGALTNLAGCSVYPTLDKPIADVNLGTSGLAAPDAVVQKLGAVYSDKTDIEVAWAMNGFTTTDYIWVGFSAPQTGFSVDVTGVNANVETAEVTYWNGQEWADCPTITDGTEAGGATWAQDGSITMANLPIDWVPAAASDTDILGTNAPATISTDELYWLRYTTTGALDANGTGIIIYGVPGLNIWHKINPAYTTYVNEDDFLHVFVIDENATIAGLEINFMAADI